MREEKQASKAERTSPKWAHHYAEPNSTSKKHPPKHAAHHQDQDFFFSFFFWVTGELSTLRQLMKVPNEPGLSPNNGLENVPLSDQSMASNTRKGQAKCPGAKTTSHDGRAGHVMTHMCHPSKARRMASVTIQVPMQGICTPACVRLCLLVSLLARFHRPPCSRTTRRHCLARQFSRPRRYASCRGAYSLHGRLYGHTCHFFFFFFFFLWVTGKMSTLCRLRGPQRYQTNLCRVRHRPCQDDEAISPHL